VDAVEGLAGTHSQNFILSPIHKLAKPLVGCHNLAAFIQDDRRDGKGVQEFLEIRHGLDVLVFPYNLSVSLPFRRGKVDWE
jgi:hypothetical protein